MRRTVALVAGVCAVALAGVAGTTAYALTGNEAEPPADRPAAAPVAAPSSPSAPAASGKVADGAAAPQAPAGRPEGAADGGGAVGRVQVGVVESVRLLLGYLDGERTMTLHYPGAEYVKPHFDRLVLLPGDHLTVSDPAGEEVHRVEGGLLSPSEGRWAMSVTGDTAVVELHTTRPDPLGLGSAVAKLGIGVDKVARGYTPAERAAAQRKEAQRKEAQRKEAQPRTESICGGDDKSDAVCYKSADPVAYERSKAVARLLIKGSELCTAWRVGASNRLITNNHCIASSKDAYDTEVWFNYQCAQCGGHAVFRSTKVWGDQVLSTDETLDYTLFTVEDFDTVEKFGYLQIDLRRPAKGEELYIPQHPAGDPAMIAMDSDEDANGTCAVENPSYTGYAKATDISYLCDTEGGSSGSPVLSKSTDKVIGLHHFGGCPNSGVRMDLIHDKIKSHL
ncbi:serine protease [Actinomycetes bacterium KLBMP 9797]